MGLMQRACETYDALAPKYAGVYDSELKEVLAPVSHIVTNADIVITIDKKGNFISARATEKEEGKVIIPVTEDSAGRTSSPVAHPLCEQLGYLTGVNEKKYELYVNQLNQWAVSKATHPTVSAVLAYVKGKSMLQDLEKYDLLIFDEKGRLKNEKDLVRWIVLGQDEPDCTKDRSLMNAFICYYQDLKDHDNKEFSMIEGEIKPVAIQHAKGIVSIKGNAKLISSNDSSGFTYRGRFVNDKQAFSISYEASQKAHNALKWLIANQGVIRGERAYCCWTPQGIEIPSVNSSLLFASEPVKKYSDYQKALKDTLAGWQSKLPNNSTAIIASFDAATSGRLALTYYRELLASDFLERLYVWDENCCWFNGRFGIQSPPLYNIVNYSFGNRRDESKIETEERVLKQQFQRLVACRIEQSIIPLDFVKALVTRCSNLTLYDQSLREKMLFTACSVIKKHYYDRKKEEWSLALEPNRKDRSYQYGRLLAILEKAERDTYSAEEKREPNAIRLQPVFVQRPQSVATSIIEQIKKAYYPRLNPGKRSYYDRMIGDIMNVISETSEKWDDRLESSYLMGYYLQKRELYQSNKEKDSTKEDL